MTPQPAPAVAAAMATALAESAGAQGLSSPNPPVGAVVLDAEGRIAGAGHTREPGGPHAEIVALAQAGPAAAGGTAVVTLEPCNHTGRTGPCSRALIDAGIAAVHYAIADPNPQAAGGAETLRAAGVAVTGGVLADEVSRGPLRPWLFRQLHGRPLITLKLAATADGRIAAPDGTSRWITGPAAREHAHAQRARIDAIVVGTGTALADDPALTARRADGGDHPHQPARVVLGHREVPAGARLRGPGGPLIDVRSHDPHAVLAALPDALWVLVEGGPTVAGAFLAAGLVDHVQLYQAPVLLGGGAAAVDDAAVTTLAQATRMRREAVTELGDDLLIDFAIERG